MEKLNALLIDDDVTFCRSFQILTADLFDLTIANNSHDGLRLLNKVAPQVVLLDYKLKEPRTGLDVLKAIKADYPDVPVIIVTEHEEIDVAVAAMRAGAIDFITKTPKIQQFKIRLQQQVQQQNWKVLFQQKEQQHSMRLIYQSPNMQELMQIVARVASADLPVLIRGETGTGKTILARKIHQLSPRREHPFVAVNCSNLPANLFESELFGHTKGAFTGADQTKKGKFELAQWGTLFLDEISDLPYESQAKILTAIEEKTFTPLGAVQPQRVDVRVITATKFPLEEAVQNKTFREDLYYRLNVFTLTIPPLRDRPADIIPLAEYFLKAMNLSPEQLSSAARKSLLSYHWPGNVRQLRNVIQRSLLYNSETSIEKIYLDEDSQATCPLLRWDELLDEPYESAKQKVMNYFQHTYFQALLERHQGNVSRAAEAAGINRTTFYRIQKEIY